MTISPHVGILAIQGDVAAHARALQRAGAQTCEVRTEKDLDRLDALVLPGGESTTISKGMARLGLYGPLRERIRAGMPVLGTCAGAILLSRQVENRPVETLELLDIIAVRNAYGTQVDSFATEVDPGAAEGFEGLRCVFIRAPRLRRPGEEVRVLARVEGEPVLVQQGHVLAATFHPELTEDLRVHRRLIELVAPG
jgi:5'-phosphate synthase pdxT subunit